MRESVSQPARGALRLEPDRLETWLEGLRRGSLPRAVVCVAPKGFGARFEPFFAEQALAALRRATEGTHGVFEHDPTADGFETSILFGDLRTGPLLGAGKLVVVRNADPLCRFAGGRRRKPGETTPLEQAVRGFAGSGGEETLLFVEAPLQTEESPLAREAGAGGATVLVCRGLSPPEAEAWLRRRAEGRGLALAEGAAASLVERAGTALAALERELDKWGSVERPLTPEDLEASSPASFAGDSFGFADAVLEGRPKEAVEALEGIRRGGLRLEGGRRERDPGGVAALLVGALYKTARGALRVRRNLDAGRPPGEGFAEDGEKFWPRCRAELHGRRRDARALEGILADLAGVERRTRNPPFEDPFDALARLALRAAREAP